MNRTDQQKLEDLKTILTPYCGDCKECAKEECAVWVVLQVLENKPLATCRQCYNPVDITAEEFIRGSISPQGFKCYACQIEDELEIEKWGWPKYTAIPPRVLSLIRLDGKHYIITNYKRQPAYIYLKAWEGDLPADEDDYRDEVAAIARTLTSLESCIYDRKRLGEAEVLIEW